MMFLNNNMLRSVAAILAFVAVALLSLAAHSLTPLMILCLIFATIPMISKLDIWCLSIFAFRFSSLRLPFFPQTLTLSELAMMTMIPFLIIYKWLNLKPSGYNLQKIAAIAFCAIALTTMVLRNEIGAKGLGSNTWGGAAYIYMFSAMLVMIWIDAVPIKPASWRKGLILMSIFATIPLVANLLFAFSGGRIYHQFSFIAAHHFTSQQTSQMGTGTGFGRLITWNGLYLMLLPFIAYKEPFSLKRRMFSATIILLSLGLICASGYRSFLLNAGMITLLWTFLSQNTARLTKLAGAAFAFLCVIMLLAVFSESIPTGAQRIVSNIPFVKVDPSIRLDSETTVLWRIEVWHRSLSLIPQHLWLGRGITYSASEIPMSWLLTQNPGAVYDDAIFKGDYHNAYLSMLICFGIPGLLTFLIFLASSAHRYWKYATGRGKWANPSLKGIYLIIAAWFFSELIIFLTIYGEIKGSATFFFFIAAILEGLIACDRSYPEIHNITQEKS